MTATMDGPRIMDTVATLRMQAGMVNYCVNINAADLSHDESLAQPSPGGNCANWIVGHLVTTYNKALPIVAQKPVMEPDLLAKYDRGSGPMLSGGNAMPFETLLNAWKEAAERFDAGLSNVSEDALLRMTPSVRGPGEETLQEVLITIVFHQSYHSGQLGLVRRIAGKAGAIT